MNTSFKSGKGLTKNTSPTEGSKQEVLQKEETYEDVDTIMQKTVDDIWEMFDDDGNGNFDVDETTNFIKQTLIEMGESPDYADADFIQCFH